MDRELRVMVLAMKLKIPSRKVLSAMKRVGLYAKNSMQLLSWEEICQIVLWLEENEPGIKITEDFQSIKREDHPFISSSSKESAITQNLNSLVPDSSMTEKAIIPPQQKETVIQNQSNKTFVDDNGRLIISADKVIIEEQEFMDNLEIISVEIPNSIRSIREEAFRGCRNMKTFIMADSVKMVGRSIFKSCISLETIKLSNGLTLLNDGLFRNCTSIRKVIIPEGVQTTKKRVFAQCTALTEVVFPSTMKTIGEEMFRGCTSIKEVNIPEGTQYFAESCITRSKSIEKLYLPRSIMSITVDESNPLLSCAVYAYPDTYAYDWMKKRGYAVYSRDGDSASEQEAPIITNYSVLKPTKVYSEGDEFFKKKDYAAAYEFYRNELTQQYNSVSAKNIIACIKSLGNDDPKTLKDKMYPYLEMMLNSEVVETKFLPKLYEIYRINGDDEKIRLLFQKQAKIRKYCVLSGNTIKTLVYIGQYQEAKLALEDLRRLKELSVRDYQELKLLILKAERNYPELFELSKEMLNSYPDCNLGVFDGFKMASLACGHPEEALTVYLDYYARTSNIALMCPLIELYQAVGAREEALDMYHTLLKIVDRKVSKSETINNSNKHWMEQLKAAEDYLHFEPKERYSLVVYEKFGIVPEKSTVQMESAPEIKPIKEVADTIQKIKEPTTNETMPSEQSHEIAVKKSIVDQLIEKSGSTQPKEPDETALIESPLVSVTNPPSRVKSRTLLNRVNKVNKPVWKYFNMYQGDESSIAYSKILFGSALTMVKRKFQQTFGNDEFEITDFKKFKELFPIYEIMLFTDEDIVEVGRLLKAFDALLMKFNTSLGNTSYKAGRKLAFLLSQKTEFQYKEKTLSYSSVDPATKDITVFGLSVFLSTFLDKDEKMVYVFTLVDAGTEYNNIFSKGLYNLIPNGLAVNGSPVNNHVKKSFDFLFFFNVYFNFVIEVERYVVEKRNLLSPDRPNMNAFSFIRTIGEYFNYSPEIVSDLNQIESLCKKGIFVGDVMEDGEIFSVRWLISKIQECESRSQGEDFLFFNNILKNACNYLYSYKYHLVFRDYKNMAEDINKRSYEKAIVRLAGIHQYLFTENDEEYFETHGFTPEFVGTDALQQKQLKDMCGKKAMPWQKISAAYYSVPNEFKVDKTLIVDGKPIQKPAVMLPNESEHHVEVESEFLSFGGWDKAMDIHSEHANIQWFIAKLEEKGC